MLTPLPRMGGADARYGFTFADDGRGAAALLAHPDDGGLEVEVWRPGPTGWHGRPTGIFAAVGDQVLPLADGRVLLLWAGGGGSTVVLLDPAEPRRPPTQLCRISARDVRLAPAPPADPVGLASLFAHDGARTRCWRLCPDGTLHPVGPPLIGFVEGPLWLPGPRLVATQRLESGTVRVIGLDPADGPRPSVLLDLGPQGEARALLGAAGAGVLVFGTGAGAGRSLGVCYLAAGRGVRLAGAVSFPPQLRRSGRIDPLALDPGGRYLLLRSRPSIRVELTVHDLRGRRGWRLVTPPGRPRGPAVWTADGIAVPWSGPNLRYGVVVLDPADRLPLESWSGPDAGAVAPGSWPAAVSA